MGNGISLFACCTYAKIHPFVSARNLDRNRNGNFFTKFL